MMGTAMIRTSSMYSADDPLGQCLRPPPTETDLERKARLLREMQARQVSDGIDEEIRQDREKMKKRREDVKVRVLLVGPAVTDTIGAFAARVWSGRYRLAAFVSSPFAS
jgi:hypothetical protein